MSAEAGAERADCDPDTGHERTVAVWRPGMTPATYRRLLRLLFDAEPGGGGTAATPAERAA